MLIGLLVNNMFQTEQVGQLSQLSTISQSCVTEKSRCVRLATDPQPAIVIHGDHITVDFSKSILESGREPYQDEDNHQGIGILISHCHDVTIKNANVYGYRVNILIDHSSNVTIDHCDVSFSQGSRISQYGKSINSFLNLRSKSSWLGYGSGIEVVDSTDSKVTGCRSCDSQNGILLIGSQNNVLTGNDCSFNSGWGFGLWHSSGNVVAFNHADYCNRPWGGDWGGDSAGIALANSCNKNSFYKDSFTHGGDGFFLSDKVNGGYSTSDQKFHFDGGCNDNVVMDCDGSWSSHNAFEATFSDRNSFLSDVASHSQYGFWIGFSNHTLISQSTISSNSQDGIAGGQGAYSMIEGNSFSSNRNSDIHFWSDPGAAQIQRPSQDEELYGNSFKEKPAIQVVNSSVIEYPQSGSVEHDWGKPDSRVPPADSTRSYILKSGILKTFRNIDAYQPADWTAYSVKVGPPNHYPKGLRWITAGDFAPVDFRDHLVAMAYPNPETIECYLMVPGVRLVVPGNMKFVPTQDPKTAELQADIPVSGVGGITAYELICKGARSKEEVYRGEIKGCLWHEKWFRWDRPAPLDFQDLVGWHRLWTGKALAETVSNRLDAEYTGRSPLPTKLPIHYFAMFAWTRLKLTSGTLEINTISDDGIKVIVDDQLVINDWNVHGAKPDHCSVQIQAGIHEIEVEYCQAVGSARLKVTWNMSHRPSY